MGYNTVTIRASDSARDRDKVILDWNDPESDCQVFVANINTLSVGVNLHHCCRIGMFLNWHLSPMTMDQIIGRLVRIGQKHAVMFYLLKTKGTYHDYLKRVNVVKRMVAMSAKTKFPFKLQGAVLEICLCELIKTHQHQPFNRYAWVVEREVSGTEMNYHSDFVVTLGHLFSLIAKLVLQHDEKNRNFWLQWHQFIVDAAFELAGEKYTPGKLELLLKKPVDEVSKRLTPQFSRVIKEIKSARLG